VYNRKELFWLTKQNILILVFDNTSCAMEVRERKECVEEEEKVRVIVVEGRGSRRWGHYERRRGGEGR